MWTGGLTLGDFVAKSPDGFDIDLDDIAGIQCQLAYFLIPTVQWHRFTGRVRRCARHQHVAGMEGEESGCLYDQLPDPEHQIGRIADCLISPFTRVSSADRKDLSASCTTVVLWLQLFDSVRLCGG